MNCTFILDGYIVMAIITAVITGMLILFDADGLDAIDDVWDWLAYAILWPFHVGKAIAKSLLYIIKY